MERREAMRFRTNIASHAVPEAKQQKVRFAALHAPRLLGGKFQGINSRDGARTIWRGCLIVAV
jgi:hypothetical protein